MCGRNKLPWCLLFRKVNLINKLRFGLFLLKMTSCELALGCVLKCVGSLGLHEAHRIQHSADLIEEMCCIIADLLFLSLSLHRYAQWMMGCAVLFQTLCTSSMPSAGRPLPPPSRACPTPPQWCEPDPCPALVTFDLSNPDTHVITGVEEIYMFPPHPGDFSDCFLWRLNQKLCILLLAILPVLFVK